VWLESFGGLVAMHVVGCARAHDTSIGRSTTPERPVTRSTHGPNATASTAPEEVPPPIEITPAPAKIPELALPPRADGAETGSQFLDRLEGMGRAATDEEVVAAILAGNVPPYQRCFVPLEIGSAEGPVARLWVTCDYLAVGSDDDFVRMPMTASAAQRIADRLDAILPTRKLVDAIYARAPQKLPPSYIDGGPTEGTLADYAVHQAKVEKRRLAAGYALGVLTAGHKKDLVLSKRLLEHPDSVAIYGWHLREGEVIQSLSTRHSRRYADYSHGVRLVAQSMTIDGEAHRVCDVLEDSELASLVCDEGALPFVAYPTTLPEYVPSPNGGAGKKKKRKKSAS
jgi:hypothetical protein